MTTDPSQLEEAETKAFGPTRNSYETTDKRPIWVRLTLGDWIKAGIFIGGITIGQVWVASAYVAKMESRIAATEQKNREQDEQIAIHEARMREQNEKLIDMVSRLLSDVGEIRGTMRVILETKR